MNSEPDHPDPITFEEFARRKQAERLRLNSMPPDEAQREVDGILHPKLWKVVDPKQLDWPGDLADDLEED
ncbi:MAG: hypothetical protein O3A00_05175 [Planctomycetota bacterium]|nr:hypothetical protein [Planctomycetota bacterium]